MNHIITELDLLDFNECSICLGEFCLHSNCLITSCGHLYHKECLRHWEKKRKMINDDETEYYLNMNKKDCPICRKDYNVNFFDKLVIDKWTEKGSKIGMKELLINNLSTKTIKLILKKVNLDSSNCLEKSDLKNLFENYLNKLSLTEIKCYLDYFKIDYSSCLEKNDYRELYEIILVRNLN